MMTSFTIFRQRVKEDFTPIMLQIARKPTSTMKGSSGNLSPNSKCALYRAMQLVGGVQTVCLCGFRYVKGVRMLNPVRAFEESEIPRQKIIERPSKMEVSYSPRQSRSLLIPAARACSKRISLTASLHHSNNLAIEKISYVTPNGLGSRIGDRVVWGSLAPRQPYIALFSWH